MEETEAGSAWSTTASNYSSSVARTSAVAAQKLVSLAESVHPINADSNVVDIGAGTGVVSLSIARNHPDSKVLAVDISAQMLEVIKGHNEPNVSTCLADALSLSRLGSNMFTHAFSTFMIQTIARPLDVLTQIKHCLKPGGVFGLGVWGEIIGPFEVWTKACRTIDPSYPGPEFDDPAAWRTPEELERAFQNIGFEDVRTKKVVMPFPWASSEIFVDFWFHGKNPGVEFIMNKWKGDREQTKEAMRKICKEEFANGQDIRCEAALCVGVKSETG